MAPTFEHVVSKFRSVLSRLLTARDDPSQSADLDNYTDWRARFTWERLTLLYILGLVANPVFIVADVLLYRQYLVALINIRDHLTAWPSLLLSLCKDQAGGYISERIRRAVGTGW